MNQQDFIQKEQQWHNTPAERAQASGSLLQQVNGSITFHLSHTEERQAAGNILMLCLPTLRPENTQRQQ